MDSNDQKKSGEEFSQRQIMHVFALAEELKGLAEAGELSACDDACALFFCVIRDNAYHLSSVAQKELERLDCLSEDMAPPTDS